MVDDAVAYETVNRALVTPCAAVTAIAVAVFTVQASLITVRAYTACHLHSSGGRVIGGRRSSVVRICGSTFASRSTPS